MSVEGQGQLVNLGYRKNNEFIVNGLPLIGERVTYVRMVLLFSVNGVGSF